MKIDLIDKNQIQEALDKLKVQMSVPEKADLRPYFGVSHAVNETTRGLARMFPHKRSICLIKGCGPYFEEIKLYFSMEGFQIQEIEFVTANQDPQWIESLKKDTLFVLCSEDDPVTGQVFQFRKFFKNLEEKKIFQIIVSHQFYKTENSHRTDPYALKICSGSNSSAFAVLGERSRKIEVLIHGPCSLPVHFHEQFLSSESKPDKKKVLNFEQKLNPLFVMTDDSRVFDRAVFYWKDMDGEAFIEELSQILKVDLSFPSQENRIETTSLCRWGGLKTMDWLKLQGLDEIQIRGLVVISANLIDENLGAAVAKARENVLKLQSGS